MYYVIRVRVTQSKKVEQCDAGAIVPPDIEMWAVIKSGKEIDSFESLHLTKEKAESACEFQNKYAREHKNKR
jgi:hypothetical protein